MLNFADDNTPQTNTTIDYYDFEFVDRNKYGAQSPKSDGEPLQLPVRQVIISHTATPNCSDYVSNLYKNLMSNLIIYSTACIVKLRIKSPSNTRLSHEKQWLG